MRSEGMKKILISAAAALFAAVLVGSIAVAEDIETVVVEATRAVNTTAVGYTSSRVPITDVSLTYRVNVSDLDLTSSAGAIDAEKRVRDVAQQACKKLGRMYPDAKPSDAECVNVTFDKAMVGARNLFANARKPKAN
jgi:UrcA family protein